MLRQYPGPKGNHRRSAERLEQVEIPVLLDSAYFASFLKQDKLKSFPGTAAYTERPATACARLCEGKAVVLVAGCPYALIVPSFFAEHFECLDDYASGAVFAGLIRILKYLAFLLAVFGPGLYVMAVAFAPEIIPIRLLTKLAQGEASTPLPPMLEMLCVTLLLEIVREAGLRAPQSISHTVSFGRRAHHRRDRRQRGHRQRAGFNDGRCGDDCHTGCAVAV